MENYDLRDIYPVDYSLFFFISGLFKSRDVRCHSEYVLTERFLHTSTSLSCSNLSWYVVVAPVPGPGVLHHVEGLQPPPLRHPVQAKDREPYKLCWVPPSIFLTSTFSVNICARFHNNK